MKQSSSLPLVDVDAIYVDPSRLLWSPDDSSTKLGQGAFGSVYKGTCDGEPCALKRASVSASSPNYAQLVREIRRYSHLRNPNVTQFMGITCLPSGELVLISELMKGGSLSDALRLLHDKNVHFSAKSIYTIATHVSRGLRCIHAEGISHGDLKPQNVLLTEPCTIDFNAKKMQFNGRAKLTDFGLSRTKDQTHFTAHLNIGAVGTLPYLAPEAFQGLLDIEQAKMADIYSFGKLLEELALEQPPYHGMNYPQMYEAIVSRNRNFEWPDHVLNRVSNDYILLVEMCCSYDPLRRPPIKMVSDELERILDYESGNLRNSTSAYFRNNSNLASYHLFDGNKWGTRSSLCNELGHTKVTQKLSPKHLTNNAYLSNPGTESETHSRVQESMNRFTSSAHEAFNPDTNLMKNANLNAQEKRIPNTPRKDSYPSTGLETHFRGEKFLEIVSQSEHAMLTPNESKPFLKPIKKRPTAKSLSSLYEERKDLIESEVSRFILEEVNSLRMEDFVETDSNQSK